MFVKARQYNATTKNRRVRKAQAFSAQGDRYRAKRSINASEHAMEQTGDFDHDAFRKAVQEGLAKGEFRLFYQPKINARTLEATGAECLLRWRRAAKAIGMKTVLVRGLGVGDEDIIEKETEKNPGESRREQPRVTRSSRMPQPARPRASQEQHSAHSPYHNRRMHP